MKLTLRDLLATRLTLIWALLVGATLASWAIGHGFGLQGRAAASAAVIIVAFVKARYVIREFMELRQAPRFMRIIADVWAMVVCSLLLALYFAA